MNEDPTAGSLPRGVTPPSGRGGRFLSDVIVELGFAERETVQQALEASRAPGKKLGNTLVEMGTLSDNELGRAIAERYRLEYLDLSEFEVDPGAAKLIGDQEMKRYEAAPVAFTEDGELVVAMADPADWLAAEEIAQLTRHRVRRAVASATDVAQVIARVAEANGTGGGSDGDAFEDSRAAPAPLTLRRVANPLMGPATPAAPPEPVGGIAIGPPTDAPDQHGHTGFGIEEEAELTPSGSDVSEIGAGREPAEVYDPETDAPPGIEIAEPRAAVAKAPVQIAAEATERGRLETELQAIRSELADARDELTSARGRLDAALKRMADADHGLGEVRTDVRRLEAELAAARDQAESLRAEMSWARRQIEQKAEREYEALADLRERIEAMEARPAASR